MRKLWDAHLTTLVHFEGRKYPTAASLRIPLGTGRVELRPYGVNHSCFLIGSFPMDVLCPCDYWVVGSSFSYSFVRLLEIFTLIPWKSYQLLYYFLGLPYQSRLDDVEEQMPLLPGPEAGSQRSGVCRANLSGAPCLWRSFSRGTLPSCSFQWLQAFHGE